MLLEIVALVRHLQFFCSNEKQTRALSTVFYVTSLAE